MLNIKGHADKSYDAELGKLTASMVSMGKLVVKLLDMSGDAIKKPSEDLREAAKTLDKEINRLDLSVEKQATEIMSKRQMFMDELRLLTSALKISTSLERMGDMAKNTVKRATKLSEAAAPETQKEILQMLDMTKRMLLGVLGLFENFNEREAEQIWAKDDFLDESYKKLFKSLQNDIAAKPEKVQDFTRIIFVAKNLERIGDHATSLARVLYYINKGEPLDKKY